MFLIPPFCLFRLFVSIESLSVSIFAFDSLVFLAAFVLPYMHVLAFCLFLTLSHVGLFFRICCLLNFYLCMFASFDFCVLRFLYVVSLSYLCRFQLFCRCLVCIFRMFASFDFCIICLFCMLASPDFSRLCFVRMFASFDFGLFAFFALLPLSVSVFCLFRFL